MNLLINIDVDDLAAAERFYVSAFGLRTGRRFGSSGVEMLGGPAPLFLLAHGVGTQATASAAHVRDYRRHWTPIHLDMVVEDIESAVERALRAGAVLEKPVALRRWGKLAVLSDPFGHGFCFVEFLGRGYDEVAD